MRPTSKATIRAETEQLKSEGWRHDGTVPELGKIVFSHPQKKGFKTINTRTFLPLN